MKVTISHYIRLNSWSEDVLYKDNKPVIQDTVVELPLKFGFGSFNEPKKILNEGINVSHVIEIKPFTE